MKIGIDIGGTSIKTVCLDVDNKVISQSSIPTPDDRRPVSLAKFVASIVDDISNKTDIDSIGCTVPGCTSLDGRDVYDSNTLGWHKTTHFAEMLEHECKNSVRVTNDGDSAAVAEAQIGAGVSFKRVLMLTLGTGIGGAFVYNGTVPECFGAGGGELGHIPFFESDDICECGLTGCFERFGCANAFERYDLDDYCNYVAIGISGLVNIFRPDVIVLGGGIAAYNPEVVDIVNSKLPSKIFAADVLGVPEVVPAKLGTYAGAIGAAINS